jgi:hypothetical protein
MISTESIINVIIVFLVTIVFGYLLGLTITKVVDYRLSDISINLPKINLPRQNIYVNLNRTPSETQKTKTDDQPTLVNSVNHMTKRQPMTKINEKQKLTEIDVKNQFQPNDFASGPNFQLKSSNPRIKPLQNKTVFEGFVDNQSKNYSLSSSNLKEFKKQTENPFFKQQKDIQSGGVYHYVDHVDFERPKKPTIPIRKTQIESNRVGRIIPDRLGSYQVVDQNIDQLRDDRKCKINQLQTRPEIGCQTDKDCNVVYGNGLNKCLSNNKCYCVEGSGLFCHYGPTYYKDPKDMTERQLFRFKLKAKFNRMTVQDYVNWLMLFEDELYQLAPRHLNNYYRLKKGFRLTLNEIPVDRLPSPPTAQNYFDQLYTSDSQENLYSPQISDAAGLQIPSNYSNYSQFSPPKNLKHLVSRPMTLPQELIKVKKTEVLEKLKPEISHDWDFATGKEENLDDNRNHPIDNANHEYVEQHNQPIFYDSTN